ALDAELFAQILVSELDLRQGEAAQAIQRMTALARRYKDEQLFRRAVDMAVQARAPEPAVATLKTWRQTLPRSVAAAEVQAQILAALGRANEAAEAARAWIELTPAPQRPAVLLGLPRLVVKGQQAAALVPLLDALLKPWRDAPATRLPALLSTARLRMAAGELSRAVDAAREAQALDATSDGAAVIGLELMDHEPGAESLVTTYLNNARPAAGIVRIGYARRLTAAQRFKEAASTLEAATASDPQLASAWLMQGALQLELGQPARARDALKRFVELRHRQVADQAAQASADGADDDEADDGITQQLSQAHLMLAQASEQLGDFQDAQEWLDRLGEQARSPAALTRRASVLARQGRVDEAKTLLMQLPEGTPEQARSKVLSQTQLLRDAQRWQEAYDLLQQANSRFQDDSEFLYEQALLEEKFGKHDDMERLLRRVIQIKPDQQHAYNALGYSLADRGLRLEEARQLIGKALQLAPGDPFITDSLGWVEFRLGNRQDALKLLRDAYDRRPDAEIAAHLGEVLWSDGQRDAALTVWRAGRDRDAGNEVLKQTLQRLKVRL
ncbi:MAG: tetratricopeptide repeat protein, partial [Leptothrix sp. (in: Bacteria)]|nr:tetratricopeptide repeat protein [Leptothrix sp. (in: b-proteobacteria)]HQY07138.1 tetratricopeptide repeat protein [Burkholderiaceae bacterium]